MSNNIYNILDKLAALMPKQEAKQEVEQKVYENVDAKGSVLEGVSAVEAKLTEKYMGWKKTVDAIEKGGSAENPEAVAAAIGRKKYGKAKFQKAAAAGKKLGEAGAVCTECGMMEGECEHSKMEDKTHKGGEVSKKDGVTRHTKTDFPGYQSDDDRDDEDKKEREGKRGRPRKHAKKEPSAEKKGRGRPKKEQPVGHNAPKIHDPFGRVKPGAEKKGDKGTKIKGKAMSGSLEEKAVSQAQQKFMGMVHAAQKGEKAASPEVAKVAQSMSKKAAKDYAATKHKGLPKHVTESVNFKRMMEETNMTLDEMLETLSHDIMEYKKSGACSETLRDFMEVYSHAKKQQLSDGIDPTNPQDYDIPTVFRKQQGQPPLTMQDVKAKDAKAQMDYQQRAGNVPGADADLNELAKLAGLSTEGNAFTGKLAQTKKGDKFDLDGKTYTDTSNLDETDMEEGNEFSGELAKARAQGAKEFEVDGKTYPVKESVEIEECGDMPTPGQSENINISSNYNAADGKKTLSVTAEGEAAEALAQLLKLSGMLGGASASAETEESIEEAEVAVDEPEEQVQSPRPKYGSIKAITTQGDDMNREKSQDPATANRAANPFTNEDVLTLEDRLAAEYESIKKKD